MENFLCPNFGIRRIIVSLICFLIFVLVSNFGLCNNDNVSSSIDRNRFFNSKKRTKKKSWVDGPFMRLKRMMQGVVTTGHKELDICLGGGLVKGSTNLLVEDGKCLGELFLTSILRKRVDLGDEGLVDCFSLTPGEVKDFCEKYDISLKKYVDSVHFVDLTGKGKNNVISLDNLDMFAPAYVSFVSSIGHKGKDVFNIVLSLSDFTCRFGEEKVYRHLKENLKTYESYKRTAIYLIKRDVNSDKYINRMKELFSSVILLKQCSVHDMFLSVEKSPLRKSSSELIRYNIGKELEKNHGVL